MKKALFKTGDKLKYVGKKESTFGIGFNPVMKPAFYKNMQVIITETHLPNKIEEGFRKNGHNIFENIYGYRAIIWPDDQSKNDWILINL